MSNDNHKTEAKTQDDPSVGSSDLFGGMAHDAGSLKAGERWGAYWKHADGWMRLYPPKPTRCQRPSEYPFPPKPNKQFGQL